jgi:hypothetical protein
MRSNPELQNAQNIVTAIRIRRLELFWHVFITEVTRIPEMTLKTEPEGRYRVGRPKLRWLDDVKVDRKTVGIKRWKLNAWDRKEWMIILRKG